MKKTENIIIWTVPIVFALTWIISKQWTVDVLSGLMTFVTVIFNIHKIITKEK